MVAGGGCWGSQDPEVTQLCVIQRARTMKTVILLGRGLRKRAEGGNHRAFIGRGLTLGLVWVFQATKGRWIFHAEGEEVRDEQASWAAACEVCQGRAVSDRREVTSLGWDGPARPGERGTMGV